MIVVNKTSITALNTKKGSVTVKWTKAKSVSGYQIQYSMKKNFASGKKTKVKKASTVSKTIKNLTSKKRYYFRIRAYKTVNGKQFYSKWSKKKSVTIK